MVVAFHRWMAIGLELLQLPEVSGLQATRSNPFGQGAEPRSLRATALGSSVRVAGAQAGGQRA